MENELVFSSKARALIHGSRLAFGALACFVSIVLTLYYYNDEYFIIWILGPGFLAFGVVVILAALLNLLGRNPEGSRFVRHASMLAWSCFVISLVGVVVAIEGDPVWWVAAGGIAVALVLMPLPFKRIKVPARIRKVFLKVISVHTLVFTILLSSGAVYYAMTEMWAPRPLYLREGKDPLVAGYQLNSSKGNVRDTLSSIYPWYQSDPTNPDAYAWGESYHLRTLVHYANATANLTIFTEAVERIEMVMAHGYEGNTTEPGFGSDTYDKDPVTGEYMWVNYDVHDGVICLPIAEAARVVLNSSGALNAAVAPLYTANATAMLDFCERIVRKWDRISWQEGDGPFGRYGFYPAAPFNATIYNRFAALGLLCCELFYITGNQTYKDKALMMGRTFKAGLERYSYQMDGATHDLYVWAYSKTEAKGLWRYGGAEDVSHGSIELELACRCHNLGEVFTDGDMETLANTFFDAVFKGIDHIPVFSNNVDGSFPSWYDQMSSYADVNAYCSANGETTYFTIIRQSWPMLAPHYREPAWADYICQKSTEVLVDAGYRGVGVIGCLFYLLELDNGCVWS